MAESTKNINESENAKLFRTRMDIFVLNALNEKDGQGYGYDVISYIQEHTKGHYKIKSISTIYNILKRLEASGYVSTVPGDNESYGAARVYYALTPAGREYLEQDKKEWKYIRTLLDNLVSDEEFDLDNEEPPYSASVLKPLTKRTRENTDHSSSSTNNSDVPCYNYTDDVDVVTEHNVSRDTLPNKDGNRSFAESAAAQYSAACAEYKKEQVQTEQNPEGEQNRQPVFFTDASYNKDNDAPITSSVAPESVEKELNPIQEEVLQPKPVEKADNNKDFQHDFSSLTPYINDLKKNLEKEGFVMHTFSADKKPSTIRYFFSNKILRDMSIASFLYLIVTLLLTNLLKNIFGISLTAMHSIVAIGMAFVLIFVISYLHEPKKRKKDDVNLKLLNSVLVLIYTVCYMAIAVYYLFTSKYSFYSPQMYAPAIILSTIPFSGLMYSILYLSGKYFQK